VQIFEKVKRFKSIISKVHSQTEAFKQYVANGSRSPRITYRQSATIDLLAPKPSPNPNPNP